MCTVYILLFLPPRTKQTRAVVFHWRDTFLPLFLLLFLLLLLILLLLLLLLLRQAPDHSVLWPQTNVANRDVSVEKYHGGVKKGIIGAGESETLQKRFVAIFFPSLWRSHTRLSRREKLPLLMVIRPIPALQCQICVTQPSLRSGACQTTCRHRRGKR